MANLSTDASVPVKPSLIPRLCKIPVPSENGGSASQENPRHDNELSVPKQRSVRASTPKIKAPSPALLPARTATAPDGNSKVAQGVSNIMRASNLPRASPKLNNQHDTFKKPQMRPFSRQQDQRPSSPTKQCRTKGEGSASTKYQPAAEPLVSDNLNTPVPRRSRPSLSERTIETISQIPPSPSPRRRKSSFYSTDSPMHPPARPASAMSNGLRRTSNAGTNRRISGFDFGFASAGEGPVSRKSSRQSSICHTPARRSSSRVSSNSTSFTLQPKFNPGKLDSTIPELTSSNHGQDYSRVTDEAVKERTSTTSTSSATRASRSRPSMQEIHANGRNLMLDDGVFGNEYTSPIQPEDLSKTSSIGSVSSGQIPFYSKLSKLTLQSSSLSDTQNYAENNISPGSFMTEPNGCTPSKGEITNTGWLRMPPEILRSTLGQRNSSSSSNPFRDITAAAKAGWPIPSILASNDGGLVRVTTSNFQVDTEHSLLQRELRERMKTAVTIGRLDISNLSLTHIPTPIARLCAVDGVEENDTLWNEANDIFEFFAANNQLKTIPNDIFPDIDPRHAPTWEQPKLKAPSFFNVMVLDMHCNELGSVPIGLRQLESLTKLDLSKNKLTNSSLEIIAQISSLCDLNLANNCLKGRVPDIIRDLRGLFSLNLSGNSLNWFPNTIGNLLHLRTLDLSDNRFDELPVEIFGTLSLVRLAAGNNKLGHSLFPKGITKLPHLEDLDVHRNMLTSFTTDVWKSVHCPALKVLNFSMNNVRHLPVTKDWPNLIALDASENVIGPMLENIVLCEKLQRADLSGNGIMYVADSVKSMKHLETLSLEGNPLITPFRLQKQTVNTKPEFPFSGSFTPPDEGRDQSMSPSQESERHTHGLAHEAHPSRTGFDLPKRHISRESEVFQPPVTPSTKNGEQRRLDIHSWRKSFTKSGYWRIFSLSPGFDVWDERNEDTQSGSLHEPMQVDSPVRKARVVRKARDVAEWAAKVEGGVDDTDEVVEGNGDIADEGRGF